MQREREREREENRFTRFQIGFHSMLIRRKHGSPYPYPSMSLWLLHHLTTLMSYEMTKIIGILFLTASEGKHCTSLDNMCVLW
jgi:hypothetical protein